MFAEIPAEMGIIILPIRVDNLDGMQLIFMGMKHQCNGFVLTFC